MEENNPEEKIKTLDDGSLELEPYYSKAGNLVTHPTLRSPGLIKDPRQDVAWEFYVKTWRAGNPNAKAAGLHAGYAPNSALNLSSFKWFKERKNKLRRSNMLTKAERNLSRILDMDYSRMKLVETGKDEEGIMQYEEQESIDKDVLRVVADVSKTIVTTLGKDEGYSTKTEVQGNMQGEIKINSISYADKPIELDTQIIDESVKLLEDEIIKEIQDGNNSPV